MIIFLFGPTGCGKNYVGEILEEEFGFFFLDADNLFSNEAMALIKNRQVISQKMRDDFIASIISQTKKLSQKHKRVAVAQAFIKDVNRWQVLKKIPNSVWIYVHSDPGIRYARLDQRKEHFASSSYARKMDAIYDPPALDHLKIDNNKDRDHIWAQLKEILDLKQNRQKVGP